MLNINKLAETEVKRRCREEGLCLRTGPFVFSVRTQLDDVLQGVSLLYSATPIVEPDEFVDFYLNIRPGKGIRRFIRPQARFEVDGFAPFQPLPRNHALPMLEWGMNWCIVAYGHHFFIIHAAAVAYHDQVLILPAPPGSGKSTLCAALVSRGWRLLSDELTLIDPLSGQVKGLARPVNLKNDSIELIQRFAPEAVLSAVVHDTNKGSVALMKPPDDSVARVAVPAEPRFIVFPRYKTGAVAHLEPKRQGESFIALADNAMNYHILGRRGFEATGRLVDQCHHYDFQYSDLDEAVMVLEHLMNKAE